jgi:hypothetical protein
VEVMLRWAGRFARESLRATFLERACSLADLAVPNRIAPSPPPVIINRVSR